MTSTRNKTLLTITNIPMLGTKPDGTPKASVAVTLSDNRKAYLGARNLTALQVGDDESKFKLTEKPGQSGDMILYIDPVSGGGFKGGGGGGGFKGAPKDEMSIVAQTIIKEAVETARQEAARKNAEMSLDRLTTVSAQLTETYQATYQKLKGANGC